MYSQIAGSCSKMSSLVSPSRPASCSVLSLSSRSSVSFCIPFSGCSPDLTLTVPPDPITLARFPSMRLKKKGITSILSIISHCSGLWISPVPRAVSLESWLTVGGSRRQQGCLSVVGRLCLPLPAAASWAYGNSAPKYTVAGRIIKDLQLRSFHTVQSASHWTANLILKDTMRYSLWTGFVLRVLSFVCNSSTFRLFLPSLGPLSASLFQPLFFSSWSGRFPLCDITIRLWLQVTETKL